MMALNVLKSHRTAAAAFAIVFSGGLMLQATAAANPVTGPMQPLFAPPCSQWGFSGPTGFNQSNGWRLDFDSTGPRAQGAAHAYHYDEDDNRSEMHGTISGGVEGYAVKVEVAWNSGALGKYEGSVDANGFASGTSYDAKTPSSTATWNSVSPLRCITPAPS
jgi:hypothetical protein